MSVSGTIWSISGTPSDARHYQAYFSGISATSGRWVDLDNPAHTGPWQQSDDVLLFKGPQYVWGSHVNGSRMHGVVTNFSGTAGTFDGQQDFEAQAKRAKKKQ